MLIIIFLSFGVIQLVQCQNTLLFPQKFCSESNWIGIQVIFNYFSDQAFMTVVDSSGHHHCMNSLSCEGTYYFRPVDVYNSLESINFGPKVKKGSLSSYSTAHGYFVRATLADFEKGFFEKLSIFNPRTSLMFNIVDASVEKSKELLRIGYEKYKMLNVAALCYLFKFEQGRLAGYDIYLCMYNPFREKTPEILCLNFKKSNLEKNLITMNAFRKKRIENLQGFPLKVNIFEFQMKSLAVRDSKEELSHYTYPDGEMLMSIAKHMNFTPVYLPNHDKEKYGFQFPNGTFTGSLAATEYGKADLVANPRLIADYNTTKSIFLQPITMTKLFFTVKKRETSRFIIITVFSKLDSTSRTVGIGLVLLFPVIYFITQKCELYLSNQKDQLDKTKTLLYVFGLLNNISMRHSKFRASQIVVATILFLALMSSSLFQGTILKDLNTIHTIGKISKIDQLFNENFTIAMQPALTYAFQGQGEDKITRELFKISRNIENISLSTDDAIKKMKADPHFAYLLTDLLTGNYLDRFYDNETGQNLFEVVPESVFQFYIAMIAPKASPFVDRFNQIINLYVQTGLYQYHTQKASDDNEKIWIHRIQNGLVAKEKSKSLHVRDLQALFKLYLGLNVLCCVVFLLEFLLRH
jgi:hypothetical protein